MESSSSRKAGEERRQADIRKQIAILQAQLNAGLETRDEDGLSTSRAPSSPKRKHGGTGLLAPATPPSKKRKVDSGILRNAGAFVGRSNPPAQPYQPRAAKPAPGANCTVAPQLRGAERVPDPAPSKVITKLAQLSAQPNQKPLDYAATRSSAFSQKPAPPIQDTMVVDPSTAHGQNRDDRLALIEDLELGPSEHSPPFDDPHFDKLEPNSGIRLSSRAMPHDEFQDYLRGRYYLPPSKLYSVIRLLPNKQGYDVPVEGDWVTVAVVAERGPIKYSKAPIGTNRDEQTHLGGDEAEKEDNLEQLRLDGTEKDKAQKGGGSNPSRWKSKAKQDELSAKPSGKKYVNLKLVDFGCRSQTSATGGKSTIRGDAFLSLLLFESDRVEVFAGEDGKKQKLYRGGSRGAFERMSKLKEGAVVALLNPRILKPFQRSGDTPHPTDNILAITPESIDSVGVIGHSLDLGMCKVTKRDGTVCGSWCDKRVSDVCEWHIQHAVERKRAGRAEFSLGTSGMSAAPKRNREYDPARQWGLKPEAEASGSGTTYVVSGHIISGGVDPKTMFIGENMGRDAQAKAARKLNAKDADRALQKLLKKDKEGMKAVVKARDFAKRKANGDNEDSAKRAEKGLATGNAARGKKRDIESDKESDSSSEEESSTTAPRGNAYSATLIRSLGFDPTGKGAGTVKDAEVQKKLDALSALHNSRKEVKLGPRPGKNSTSVRPPERAVKEPSVITPPKAEGPSASFDLDSPELRFSDSGDEMEHAEIAAFGKKLNLATEKLVVLDSSSDLEIEDPAGP